MPPKPFNPPRPSGSFSSSSIKPKPKPKPSKPTFSSPSASASRVTKSKPKSKYQSTGSNLRDRPKDTGKPKPSSPTFSSPSASASRVRGRCGGFVLPSLSPDSDVQGSAEEEAEEEEDSTQEGEEGSDEDASSLPDLSRSLSGSKSKRRKSGGLDLDPGEEDDEVAAAGEHIPTGLLSVLLRSYFTNKGTGAAKGKTMIREDATRAVGKYMDTFVREAVARAAYGDGSGVGGGLDGGVLEVESLERLCPQLLLDF